jgi:hypothetical protein
MLESSKREGWRELTDGASDCYHLQVAALEPPCKRRVCCVCCCSLWVKHVAVGADSRLWRHGHGKVGVALEAVEHTTAEAFVVAGRFAIVVGSLGGSAKALFGAVDIVVHGEAGGKARGGQNRQGKGGSGAEGAEGSCTLVGVAAGADG